MTLFVAARSAHTSQVLDANAARDSVSLDASGTGRLIEVRTTKYAVGNTSTGRCIENRASEPVVRNRMISVRRIAMLSWMSALLALAGCDQKRIDKLEEGVATEADVRQQFGEPQATHTELDGSKTFEFSRQPEGQVAYMITIGPDGKMSALRQVLKPADFEKIVPGMNSGQVRRMLGRPASVAKYDLKPDEEHWNWRWLDGQAAKVFTVTFNRDGTVVSTAVTDDPRETLRPG